MNVRARHLGLLALLGLALLLFGIHAVREMRANGSEWIPRSARTFSGGVSAREFDPANAVTRYADGYGTKPIAGASELLDESEVIGAQVVGAPEVWGDLDLWTRGLEVDTPFAHRMNKCAPIAQGLTKECSLRIDVLVERTGPDTGAVAYSRATTDDDTEHSCSAYADCMASAWVRRPAPLPDTARASYAFHMEQGIWPPPPPEARRQFLEQQVAGLQSILAEEEARAPSGFNAHQLRIMRANLEYWRKLLEADS